MVAEDAFYLPLGEDRYEPTRATESPWDARAQHGGPPAALLAHVIDSRVDDGLRLGRISVDFLGPIPRREAVVEVSTLKPGRRVRLSEARMNIDGRTVAIARTWHIASGPQPPVVDEPEPPDTSPSDVEPRRLFPDLAGWGYGDAIEWRFVDGTDETPGEARVWTRVRLPLVAGEQLTGQARVLIVADSANGLSASLPLAHWYSIPPTMTTTLLRPATGEWVHLDCRTRLSADGLGAAHGKLADPCGYVGDIAQPLLIQQR